MASIAGMNIAFGTIGLIYGETLLGIGMIILGFLLIVIE